MNYLISFFEGFKNGLLAFSSNTTIIINTILLTMVYVISVGITSLVAKFFHVHFLKLKIEKKKKSYWSTLNIDKRPLKEYYRQF